MNMCENCPIPELIDEVQGLQLSENSVLQDLGWLCMGLMSEEGCQEPRQLEEAGPLFCGHVNIDIVRRFIDTTLAATKSSIEFE